MSRYILGIDTSCDETSVAVVRGRRVLSNVVSSQIRYHKKYGGVVPFLAQRLHRERIDAVVNEAVQRAGVDWETIEAIAITAGPGLAPALGVGIDTAKALAATYGKPLYEVNHMMGHIASCFVQTERHHPPIEYPALALLVSGGHTEMALMRSFDQVELIGETLDDALGEAYDKVAKMLGLGYPGGGLVAKLAEAGNPALYPLPIPMIKSKELNISYSGLKNAVRLLILKIQGEDEGRTLTQEEMQDVCAAFEYAAQTSLMRKLDAALVRNPEIKTLLLAGGVALNKALRQRVRTVAKKYGVAVVVPHNRLLCTDNGAMIGVAAHLGIEAGQQPIEPEALDRRPGWSL